MKCIAIDDETLALQLLEHNISQVPYLELINSFHNPLKAMAFIESARPDLIFIDIEMPGLTGLDFIKSLPYQPMVILVTAYEKFALDGFALNVIDYLVKPVELARFFQACNKARTLFELKNRAEEAKEQHLFVNSDHSLVKIEFDDISWIESLKEYVRIHLRSTSRPVVSRMTMKSFEDLLPAASFLRIHKSYLVSKKAISAVKKNSVFLGTLELPVSDTYREAIQLFIGKNP
ncbi:MAG: response regulator transcription factor [Chitinophagaceae bacterium]|nr:MAG: response regulator transcription factor [Chitinophagaceae bacterium]